MTFQNFFIGCFNSRQINNLTKRSRALWVRKGSSRRTINAIKILQQRHVILENSQENIRGLLKNRENRESFVPQIFCTIRYKKCLKICGYDVQFLEEQEVKALPSSSMPTF